MTRDTQLEIDESWGYKTGTSQDSPWQSWVGFSLDYLDKVFDPNIICDN